LPPNFRAVFCLRNIRVDATFQRKTDAKKWLKNTESAIREGRHFAFALLNRIMTKCRS